MPITVAEPEIATPFRALSEWSERPETRVALANWLSEATAQVEQAIAEDNLICVPRKPEERAEKFATWREMILARTITPLLRRLRMAFGRTIEAELPKDLQRFGPARVAALLWTETESHLRHVATEYLLRYALSGIVLNFSSRRLGDNWLVGIPERRAEGWLVPLYASTTPSEPVAFIETDGDGNILSDDVELRRILKVEW